MFNEFHKNGVIAFKEKDYDTAKNLFHQAIDHNPETALSYFYLGSCYFFFDDKPKVISYLKRFIDLNQFNHPDEKASHAYAFDLLGQCYEAENKRLEALKCYTQSIEIYPYCASAWHNIGLHYMKSARSVCEIDLITNARILLEKALINIEKALEICSDNPIFLHSLACWHEQHIEILEKLIEDKVAISSNFNHAKQYYEAALSACKPEDLALKTIVLVDLTECLIQHGHFYFKNRLYGEAQRLYEEVLTYNSSHMIVISQLGLALLNQKEYSKARKCFKKIFAITTDIHELADAWLYIAITYRSESQWDKAHEALLHAKDCNPEDPYIAEEQKYLFELKAATVPIFAIQTLFSTTTGPVTEAGASVVQEEPGFAL